MQLLIPVLFGLIATLCSGISAWRLKAQEAPIHQLIGLRNEELIVQEPGRQQKVTKPSEWNDDPNRAYSGTPAALVDGALYVPTNGEVGKLPAMGWNSWNAYACDISENTFLSAAQKLVQLGLKDAGYEYVNIDDCWSTRDRNPVTLRMVPHPERFPHGILGLSKEIHAMGLKFGIYSDSGDFTCQKYPGSLNYEDVDAKSWEEWEVDYLKLDNCYIPKEWEDDCRWCLRPNTTCQGNICPPEYNWKKSNTTKRYQRMQNALSNITRPILYSLCNGGAANVQDWAGLVGQSWRATDDIQDNWPSVLELIGLNAYGVDHTDFYGHSDADMLEIGNGGLNQEQERSHFALWAAMKSPLLIGTNLANIKPSSLEILKSKTLIAFSQDDKYGKPAKPFKWDRVFRTKQPPQYWSGVFNGGVMVLILNTNNQTSQLGFEFSESPNLAKAKAYEIVDGWTGKEYGCFAHAVSVTNIKAYDTAVLVLKDGCSGGGLVKQTPDLVL